MGCAGDAAFRCEREGELLTVEEQVVCLLGLGLERDDRVLAPVDVPRAVDAEVDRMVGSFATAVVYCEV